MAQRIDVPGIGIVEFPDTMSDADIVTAIGNLQKQNLPSDIAAFKAMGGEGDVYTPPEVPVETKATKIKRGLKEFFTQPSAEPVVPEWGMRNPNLYGLAGAGYETLFKKQPFVETAGLLGGAAGGALASPILGPAGPVVGAGTGYAGAKALERGLGAELGLLPAPTVSEAAMNIPEDIGRGAMYEMGGQVAGKALSEGLPSVLALGRGAKSVITGKPPVEVPQIAATAERFNVPLSYGDIRGGTAAEAERLLENVPLSGMTKFRGAQKTALETAAENVVNKSTIDDWAKVAKESLTKRKNVIGKITTDKYNKVAELADTLGDAPAPNLNKKAYDLFKEEMKVAEPYRDKATIDLLSKYAQYPKTNWSGLRKIRTDLNSTIADIKTGKNAVFGDKTAKILGDLKSALDTDLATFAQSNSDDLYKAWKDADAFYKKYKLPYKDLTDVRTALDSKTPYDEIYGKFIKKGREGRALRFYQALDGRGREAIRSGMLETAYNNAFDPATNAFSSLKFARELKNLESATNVFFKGEKRAEVEGLKNLFQHLGETVSRKPATIAGVNVKGAIAGAAPFAGYASPAATGGVLVSGAGLRILLTSDAGKRLLLTASKTKPFSPAMNKLIESMTKITALGAEEALNE